MPSFGPELPQGQVRIFPLNDPKWPGWFQVCIGRAKFTKVFNLSDAEARQLRDQLEEILCDHSRNSSAAG